jgi:general secretion pathway protein A
MYSKFYGFTHKPFELAPDPGMVFLSETHQEALAVLLYGVYNRKGFLQISGRVGTGKSTLVQALIDKLEDNVVVCHIPNPHFTVAEFYYYLGAKFGFEPFDGNRAKFILDLAAFLKQCRENGAFVLLIIDEAQMLSLELLEEIRLLSNQEFSEFGVLSIFFVGQPELNGLLKHKKMEPLRNRIGIRFNLEPLSLTETAAYIRFRLQKAGRSGRLFSPGALKAIHVGTGGVPRSINILCDNSLLTGFAEQRTIIDEEIIAACIKEIEQPSVRSAVSREHPVQKDTTGKYPEPVPSLPPTPPPAVPIQISAEKKARNKGFKWKRFALAACLLLSLFIAAVYTTDYWEKISGARPAAAWFEQFRNHDRVLAWLRDLIARQNVGAQPGNRPEVMVPTKTAAPTEQKITSVARMAEPGEAPTGSIAKAPSKVPEPARLHASIPSTAQDSAENDAAAENAVEQDNGSTGYPTAVKQAATGSGRITLPVSGSLMESGATIMEENANKYGSITIQVGGANIRTGPSMEYPVIRAVSPGFPFRVVGRNSEWTLVEDYRARRGWVSNSLITESRSVILLTEADLQSGPGYNGTGPGTTIPFGTVLHVLDKQNNWLQVYRPGGPVGWVSTDKTWP